KGKNRGDGFGEESEELDSRTHEACEQGAAGPGWGTHRLSAGGHGSRPIMAQPPSAAAVVAQAPGPCPDSALPAGPRPGPATLQSLPPQYPPSHAPPAPPAAMPFPNDLTQWNPDE